MLNQKISSPLREIFERLFFLFIAMHRNDKTGRFQKLAAAGQNRFWPGQLGRTHLGRKIKIWKS